MVDYDVEKNEAYFQDIYRNAVELSAMLCRQYRLDPMEPGVILTTPAATPWGSPATTAMWASGSRCTGRPWMTSGGP